MAQRIRIQRPPPSGNAGLDLWLEQVADALNQFPAFSIISTSDGPESAVSANPGTIAIDVGSSATTLWFKESGNTSTGWSHFSHI